MKAIYIFLDENSFHNYYVNENEFIRVVAHETIL